jgi:type 1 glutamine amidotransferase
MGGKFLRHPKLQKFTIQVTDPNTPITRGLPSSFEWEDECYYQTHLNPDIHVLLAADRSKLVDPKTDDSPEYVNGLLPLAWMHEVGTGRVFYVALGHKNEHYTDPTFRKILLQGIKWAMRTGK